MKMTLTKLVVENFKGISGMTIEFTDNTSIYGANATGKTSICLMVAFTLGAAAETMVCTIPEGQYVNIRKQAKRDSSAWGMARNGDEIEAVSVNNGWVEFDYDGNTAYAMAKYFEIEEDGDYTVTANGRVRYRESPNGKVLGFYEIGTAVHVDAWQYDKQGNLWGRIGERFVASEYLSEAANRKGEGEQNAP